MKRAILLIVHLIAQLVSNGPVITRPPIIKVSVFVHASEISLSIVFLSYIVDFVWGFMRIGHVWFMAL